MPNTESPKISIVLPTFNGARYIRQSIDSCLNQTYKNIELIIVDDASSDDTPEIIKLYKDTRIRYFRHNKNLRLPRALNTGLRNTVGEYLTWTSDDNQFLPTAIEELLLCFRKNNNLGLVYSDYLAHYFDTKEKVSRILPDNPDLKKENQIGACFLFSRKAFQATGYYNPKYELVEDYEYWIRMCRKTKTLHYPKQLYIYGEHNKSLKGTKLDSIVLFDHILRYQYGFISLAELTKQMSLYLRNVKYGSTTKEAVSIYTKTIIKISRISISLGLLFVILLSYLTILKGIKHASAACS